MSIKSMIMVAASCALLCTGTAQQKKTTFAEDRAWVLGEATHSAFMSGVYTNARTKSILRADKEANESLMVYYGMRKIAATNLVAKCTYKVSDTNKARINEFRALIESDDNTINDMRKGDERYAIVKDLLRYKKFRDL